MFIKVQRELGGEVMYMQDVSAVLEQLQNQIEELKIQIKQTQANPDLKYVYNQELSRLTATQYLVLKGIQREVHFRFIQQASGKKIVVPRYYVLRKGGYIKHTGTGVLDWRLTSKGKRAVEFFDYYLEKINQVYKIPKKNKMRQVEVLVR